MFNTVFKFFLLFFSVSLVAQTEAEVLAEAAALDADSLKTLVESGQINRLDSLGHKTGVWARFYPDGTLEDLGEFVVVYKSSVDTDTYETTISVGEIQVGDWWYFNGEGALMWRASINRAAPFEEIYEFRFYYDGQLEKRFIKDKELKWFYQKGQLKHYIDYVEQEEFYYKNDGKIQHHHLMVDGVKEKRKFYYQKKTKNLISIVPVDKIHPDLSYVVCEKATKRYFTDTTFLLEFEKPTLSFIGRYGDWIQDSIWITNHRETNLSVEDIQIPGSFQIKKDTSTILAKDSMLLIIGQYVRPTPNFFQYELFDVLFDDSQKITLITETQTWHLNSNDFLTEDFNKIKVPLSDNVFYWREGKEALLEIYPNIRPNQLTEDKVIKRFPIATQQAKLDLSELPKGKYLFKITNYTNNTIKFVTVLGVRD